MPEDRLVLTLVDQGSSYGRGVLEGIGRYGVNETDWTVYPLTTTRNETLSQLQSFQPIGIIARGREDEPWREYARQQNIPVVLVAQSLDPIEDYAVLPNYRAIGAMGAAHLIERGYHHLAFRGGQYVTHQQTVEGFVTTAMERGIDVDAIGMRNDTTVTEADIITIQQQWLSRVKHPLGVMTTDDHVAAKVIVSANREGLQFGRDIAVLGVHNNNLLCENCRPSISSIAMPLQRIGYLAGQMLHQLIEGHTPDQRAVRLEPSRVVVRGSTDLAATDDFELVKAVDFIRSNMQKHIGVQDVADYVSVSRRTLERRFKKHLHHTVDHEIRRQRIEQASRLLVETDLTQRHIATMCGFGRPEQLSRTFLKLIGVGPIAYRKQNTMPI